MNNDSGRPEDRITPGKRRARHRWRARRRLRGNMNRRLTQVLGMALLVAIISVGACAPKEKTSLRVLFAGSLIVPFHELEAAFEQAHPDVDVLVEGHGSIQVVRHVTELPDYADVVAVADYTLIPALMYTTSDPDTDRPYADWAIEFATNRLTLSYTDQSLYADQVDADNWYSIINRPGVRVGLPDPRFDAAGYRGLMALQLAELHYENPVIFENAVMGRFRSAITVEELPDRWVIHVPEIVEPKKDSGIIVRGGSIQLIALLQSGDLDYAFEYESVARQQGFHFVNLPDAVNLGSEAHAEQYNQVQVKLDFQRFASVNPEFQGEFIKYGLSIPSSALQPDLAAEFIAFILGPEGQEIMANNYHPLILPPRVDHYERLPQALRDLCVPAP